MARSSVVAPRSDLIIANSADRRAGLLSVFLRLATTCANPLAFLAGAFLAAGDAAGDFAADLSIDFLAAAFLAGDFAAALGLGLGLAVAATAAFEAAAVFLAAGPAFLVAAFFAGASENCGPVLAFAFEAANSACRAENPRSVGGRREVPDDARAA